MQKLQDELPMLHFDEPPKICLKCVPLDRYTKSPYLSGAVVCAKAVYKRDSFSLQIGSDSVEVDVFVGVDLGNEKKTLGIEVYLDVRNSDGEKVYISKEFGALKNRYRTTVCKLDDLPWYQSYFVNIYKNVGTYNITAHNGVYSGDCKRLFGRWLDHDLGAIILLADQYRPGVTASRAEIRELSLEMACDIILIKKEIEREGYVTGNNIDTLVNDIPWMIPSSAYYSFMQKRPDLKERLTIYSGERVWQWREVSERIEQEQVFVRHWKLFNLAFRLENMANPMNLKEEFCLVCLKHDYTLRMDIDGDQDNIYIRRKESNQTELQSDIFPPSLFIYPNAECRYLTRELRADRHFCNAAHRLSQFMLKNADSLQQEVPGILKEMIRTLQDENGEKLISGINNLLERLRSLPKQSIQVPPDLCLTTEDLYYTERDDSV